MCGITGVVSISPIDLTHVVKMNKKLQHRGPNDSGYVVSTNTFNSDLDSKIKCIHNYCYVNFALGHQRLAIHDLRRVASQPMSYLNRYWIVYNGEIYNFLELRSRLTEAGYVFYTNTDTEVVIAAYDFWGKECLNKFNGEWSFVLLDLVKNKIFISRDRFGIKPLYYYIKPGLFIFGSEIKALLEYPEITRQPNMDYLKDFIKKGKKSYFKSTAFQDIYSFCYASYIETDIKEFLQNENLNFKKFWTIKFNLSNEVLSEKKLMNYSKKYLQLLKEAVAIRLRSDVKIGTCLSGGLDSASLLYMIHKLTNDNSNSSIEAFSSTYQTKEFMRCDESHLINHLAKNFNTQSNQIEPKLEEVPNELRKLIYHMDMPVDSSLMSSWYTAKLHANYNVVVTLSGEGADEQLAGYLRYLTYYFANLKLRLIYRNYLLFRKICGSKIYLFVGIFFNLLSKLFSKRFTQFLYKLSRREEKLFTLVNEKLEQDLYDCLTALHHIDDRVFMAHSIELRVPFMDHLLVEFLASVPASYKLAKGWTKYLARFSFAGILPDNVNWNREKKGWPVPEEMWFKGKLQKWMDQTIQHSIFLQKYGFYSRNKRYSIAHKIRLLNTAIWYDLFFNENIN